jgi:hypothetical protein
LRMILLSFNHSNIQSFKHSDIQTFTPATFSIGY